MREGVLTMFGRRDLAKNERVVLFQCRKCFTTFRGVVPVGFTKMCARPDDEGPRKRELVACRQCKVFDAWPVDVFDAERAAERKQFTDPRTLEWYAADDIAIEASRRRFERLEAADLTDLVEIRDFWASSYGVFPEGPALEPAADEEREYRRLQSFRVATFQALQDAQARYDTAEEAERAFVMRYPDKVFREISDKDWERATSEPVETWKLTDDDTQTEPWPDEV